MTTTAPKYCDFCLILAVDVKHLYWGAKSGICEDCVAHLYSTPIFLAPKNFTELQSTIKPVRPKTPLEIKMELDKYVIGQDKAKKILSVAVHNHLKRGLEKRNNRHIVFDKTNVLILGPTGSGKTALIKALEKIVDCPIGIADATILTEAGTWGGDVPSIIWPMLQSADKDAKKAEYGIVYLDEADKIARGTGRTITTTGVQRELLKILEGATVDVPHCSTNAGSNHTRPNTTLNTANILFILGGAFSDMDKISGSTKSAIGFNTNTTSNESTVSTKDVVEYGFMPELVGRLHSFAQLKALEENDLVKILTEPNNSLIDQYKEIFRMDNVILEFEPESLKTIAKYAILRKTGARGLKQILEEVLFEFMFDVKVDESYTILITAAIVEDRLKDTACRIKN